MIILIDNEKEMEFKNAFDPELNLLLIKYFKLLFIENDILYFVMTAKEEGDVAKLRKAWAVIRNKCITILKVKDLKNVPEAEEKILFFQKAVEICNAKKVEITLK